jgi:hypothetical protein
MEIVNLFSKLCVKTTGFMAVILPQLISRKEFYSLDSSITWTEIGVLSKNIET